MVVITNMDMPNGCCMEYEIIPGRYINSYCELYDCCSNRDIYNTNTRPKDCPLKSIDEAFAEMKEVNK